MADLSRLALDALMHALGYDHQERRDTRNYYVADHHDAACAELVAAGMMHEGVSVGWLPATERLFRATKQGECVARAETERLRWPPPNSMWRHFKGNLYRVERVVDGVVHYVAERDGGEWTRPVAEWHEHVERPDWNYSGPRFVEVAGG